jgi:choline-sulfatase
VSAPNFLVIMSDEHNPKIAGYAGHPVVDTPNLDALAARGTASPRPTPPAPCASRRAPASRLGKYIHQIGFWDNADAYDGSVPSWHHMLRERGPRVVRSASCTSACPARTTASAKSRSPCTSSTARAT